MVTVVSQTSDSVPGGSSEGPRVRSRISTREALRFLMEAGQTLSHSLDYEATMQALADLAVPRVACYCVVDLMDRGGGARRVAMAHRDAEQLPTLSRTTILVGPLCSAYGRLVETGEPTLISPVTDAWLREATLNEEHLQLTRLLAPTSLMLVPLIARGKAIGLMTLASTRTDRFYGDDDVLLARELGRTASLALDNARLYRQAQDALKAREDLLRVVAHDLRNPINAVLLGASFLMEEAPKEFRASPFGRTAVSIHNSAKHANRMLQDLLDVSRMETGHLALEASAEPVAPLLREAVEMQHHVAMKNGVEIDLQLADDLPPVLADRERLLQVVGNLLGNALKFTSSGGRVQLGARLDGDDVHFWVADTGAGIAPEHLSRLFEPFWQASGTDRRGLGLGLAIVKGLVQAHGGRTWAESTLGAGTRMHFTLPRARMTQPS